MHDTRPGDRAAQAVTTERQKTRTLERHRVPVTGLDTHVPRRSSPPRRAGRRPRRRASGARLEVRQRGRERASFSSLAPSSRRRCAPWTKSLNGAARHEGGGGGALEQGHPERERRTTCARHAAPRAASVCVQRGTAARADATAETHAPRSGGARGGTGVRRAPREPRTSTGCHRRRLLVGEARKSFKRSAAARSRPAWRSCRR